MTISKSQRALVVVCYLSASKKWFDGYNFIEASGMATIDLLIAGKYGTVTKLKDANATKAKFLSTLKTLGAKSTIKAIDVIMMTHGNPNKLYFYKNDDNKEETISTPALGADIKALKLESKLRLLYSTACYGSSHNNDFVNAGFCASVGAKAINTNSATEFPIVLGSWGGGDKISTAISWGEQGYVVFDAIAKLSKDWEDSNSDKDILGDGSIRIDCK